MKICSVCGEQIPDGASACPKCGSVSLTVPEDAGLTVVSTGSVRRKETELYEENLEKRKKTMNLIIIASVSVVVIAAFAFIMLSINSNRQAHILASETDGSYVYASEAADASTLYYGDSTAPSASAAAETSSEATSSDNSAPASSEAPSVSVKTSETPSAADTTSPYAQELIPDTTEPVSASETDKTDYNTLDTFIRAANSLNYSIKGTTTIDNATTPIGLICRGQDFRMSSEMDGRSMDIAVIDDKIYMINNDAKTYMILSSALAKTMGISVDDLRSTGFTWNMSDASTATAEPNAVLDGAAATCYNVKCEVGYMKVYIVDGKIKCFRKYSDDGSLMTTYRIDEFRTGITDADIDPSGSCKKQNMISFMGSLM